jgi:hypothetical protein
MAAEAFGTATAAIGLAASVFQTAKGVRDTIHLVSSSLVPSETMTLTYSTCPQAMSENDEIVNLLEENKAEVDFLIETYNEHKELLDQHKLTVDLEELLEYVPCYRLQVNIDLSLLCRKVIKLQSFLIESKGGKPGRKLPSLKAVWKAGDLKPKLEALNRGIIRTRTHWKVWPPPFEPLLIRKDG